MAVKASSAASRSALIAVVAASVAMLLASGIIYGYQSLLPMLQEHGVFASLCDDSKDLPPAVVGNAFIAADATAAATANAATDDEVTITITRFVCTEQKVRLNLVFTITMGSLFLFTLPFGKLMDSYGPRLTMSIGIVISIGGSILVAFGGDWGVTVGIVMFAPLSAPQRDRDDLHHLHV
jgi:MFS family permease